MKYLHPQKKIMFNKTKTNTVLNFAIKINDTEVINYKVTPNYSNEIIKKLLKEPHSNIACKKEILEFMPIGFKKTKTSKGDTPNFSDIGQKRVKYKELYSIEDGERILLSIREEKEKISYRNWISIKLNKIPIKPFTPCEMNDICMSVSGFNSDQVAEIFDKSPRTVEMHVSNAASKVRCSTRLEFAELMLINKTFQLWHDLARIILVETNYEHRLTIKNLNSKGLFARQTSELYSMVNSSYQNLREKLSSMSCAKMTPKELDCICFYLGGLSAKQIAILQASSDRTIQTHISHAMMKIGVTSDKIPEVKIGKMNWMESKIVENILFGERTPLKRKKENSSFSLIISLQILG